jgi:hypothetical protein
MSGVLDTSSGQKSKGGGELKGRNKEIGRHFIQFSTHKVKVHIVPVLWSNRRKLKRATNLGKWA